jgi:cell division protein FtsB
VGVVLSVLAVGLVGLLLLTTQMQQRAFALFDLQSEIGALREQRQSLQAELAQLEAPASLAESARLLGMVPNQSPAFLDLDSGTVRGELVPAPAQVGAVR